MAMASLGCCTRPGTRPLGRERRTCFVAPRVRKVTLACPRAATDEELKAAPQAESAEGEKQQDEGAQEKQTPQPPPPPPSASSLMRQHELVQDAEFSLAKVSFGSIVTPVGVGLLVYGFGAYFTLLPGADVSSVLLIYGFPLALLGSALSYAQLEPVPCKTTKEAFAMRDSQMTDIQKQVREDVTRYRYGDEQHLDESLARIFRFGRQGGIPKKMSPKLKGVREQVIDGGYTLVLEFASKLNENAWQGKQEKFETFFGPGVKARVEKTEAGADVLLISDGSGKGRGGTAQKDALPPLLPGLRARKQQ